MSVLNILERNIKWRFQNPITIVMSIIQPMIWLLLYSTIAGQTMTGMEGGNYTAFILPGILVLVTFAGSGFSGVMNYTMKADGSFYRIQISPTKRSAIVLGNMLEAILLSFLEAAILFILSLLLAVQVASGLSGLLLMVWLLFLTAFFMAGLSYSISLCLPNQDAFYTLMNTIVLPIFFVSTALFPLENITGGFRLAVMLNPFTHIINSLRNLVFTTAIDWQNILMVTGLFLVLCCFSFMLAVWSLQREGKK